MRRVAFRSCRLTGAVVDEARLEDVAFTDCRVDLASFARSELRRVSFDRCILTGSDLLETELSAVRLTDCDLTDADLRDSRWRDCTLRGCRLTAVRGVEALRGVAIPIDDVIASATVFAAALGIKVVED